MLLFLRFPTSKAAISAAVFLIHGASGLSAQNFTARSASLNPFGVNGPLPFGEMPDLGVSGAPALKGGFATGIGLFSVYDSNILLSEDDPESDVTLSATPSLSYTTDPEGGAKMVIMATYSPSASASLNNSDYNAFDQNGSISMIVSGARTTVTAYAGISQDSGADSLAASQGFFTGTAISLGIQGSYQVAPRTTMNAGVSSSIVDYGESAGDTGSAGGSAVGLGSYTANVGGAWAATERLSFGPSLSYSVNSSDTTADFNTWGFSMVGSYKVSEKIQMAASLGVQYSDYSEEGQSGGISPTGSLNATYQINELWSWGGSIQSGLTPSPTGVNYVINGWSLSSSLSRQLLIGSIGLGLNMDFSNFDSVGPTGAFPQNQDAQQNLGLSLNYARPLFNDRVGFTSSLLYNVNYGDAEWSQIQLSAGLNMSF